MDIKWQGKVYACNTPREKAMLKLSAKRQITLPAGQCKELDIQLGDEIGSFILDGRITMIKKHKGAAKGFLKHVQSKKEISEDNSLQSALP